VNIPARTVPGANCGIVETYFWLGG